jgi:hypothetical protein
MKSLLKLYETANLSMFASPPDPKAKCFDEASWSVATAIVALINDLIITVLPFPLVLRMTMVRRDKIVVLILVSRRLSPHNLRLCYDLQITVWPRVLRVYHRGCSILLHIFHILQDVRSDVVRLLNLHHHWVRDESWGCE